MEARLRGYDPRTGRELWRLGRSSKVTAPTPVFDERELFAIGRAGANAVR